MKFKFINHLIRTISLTFIIGSLGSVGKAREFPVNDQDQANILIICDTAAQSATISRDMRSNVSNFCVAWEQRMKMSNEIKPSVPPSPQPPKTEGSP